MKKGDQSKLINWGKSSDDDGNDKFASKKLMSKICKDEDLQKKVLENSVPVEILEVIGGNGGVSKDEDLNGLLDWYIEENNVNRFDGIKDVIGELTEKVSQIKSGDSLAKVLNQIEYVRKEVAQSLYEHLFKITGSSKHKSLISLDVDSSELSIDISGLSKKNLDKICKILDDQESK